MSWSASFLKPVPKAQVAEELNTLTTGQQTDPAAFDQLQTARTAVRCLLPNIPGPYVMVSMSGHANGVGWQKKAGWANDCISISITQICEEDLQAGVK